MKLEFLGTGAADYHLRDIPEGNFRRHSSLLIDKKLLVDPGSMIFHYRDEMGTPDLFDGVEAILLTHSHSDHFSPESVARLAEKRKIPVYAHASAVAGTQVADFRPLEFFAPVNIAGYEVTLLPSNHLVTGEETGHYLIQKDALLFYGLDGSLFPTATWLALRHRVLDACVIDYTVGVCPGDHRLFEHNNFTLVREIHDTFLKNGVVRPDSLFILSHLARTLHPVHAEEVALCEPLGMTVAYDGYAPEVFTPAQNV